MFKTLRSRVIATYLVVVVISLLLVSFVFVFFRRKDIQDYESSSLLQEVTVLASEIGRLGGLLPATTAPQSSATVAKTAALKSFLAREARVIQARLFLLADDGSVIAETGGTSLNPTAAIPPQFYSTEGTRAGERYFPRLGETILFASAPTHLGNQSPVFLLGVEPLEQFRAATLSLIWYVLIAGLIALLISMSLALYLSGTISRPVGAVAEAARGMATGDYRQRVEPRGPAESVELANEFNLMAERVQTAYELQRDFTANVSHELRTPLTSIEGFSQALLDGTSQGETERLRSIQIINEESTRLVRVLRDLLMLSQIDSGEVKPEMRYVDLVDLLRKLENLYAGRSQDSRVTLKVDTPPFGLTAYTDRDRLERVLTNLLDNAMKYTGEGGTVVLSAATELDAVHISVADNGPGIEEDLVPRIFDRFYRVRSRSRSSTGAGLGLAICKELVESLGGRIWVSSVRGQGTTFTVSLPT
jgi:signal transduction histidine kinase